MKRSKNEGFTLIELAIVLVVIGLIIAAVLKGEDLIQNARMLNFVTNPVQKAQVAAMAYYDRTGQFPSVSTTGGTTYGPLYQMYQAGIDGVLDLKNPFTAGSDSLGMALGTITVQDSSGNTANYPVIVIQPVTVPAGGGTPTATSWTQSELGYANYLKSRIDGSTSDWTTGSVRMLNTSIAVTYTAISREITPTPTTSTYDGYFTPGTYSINDFETPPPAGTSNTDTLVYFYNQQPH